MSSPEVVDGALSTPLLSFLFLFFFQFFSLCSSEIKGLMILRVWAAREKVLVLMWVGVFGFEAGLGLLVLVQQYFGLLGF